MLDEDLSPGASTAPTRAGLGLLNLQLRGALREAADAEAAEAAIDIDAATAQLRARLDPLFEQRRTELGERLRAEQDKADTMVAAAVRAAEVMRAQALSRVATVVAPVPEVVVEPEPVAFEVVVEPEAVVEPVAPEMVVESAEPEPVVESAGPANDAPHAATIVIDAEAFARVFASVMMGMLDERAAALGTAPQWAMQQAPSPQPLPAPPVKQSFWKHAWHADVVLLGLSTVIVLVVLAAWLA